MLQNVTASTMGQTGYTYVMSQVDSVYVLKELAVTDVHSVMV